MEKKTTSYENDYSLLRPFDLEAAQRGEAIEVRNTRRQFYATYLAGPNHQGLICLETESGLYTSTYEAACSMAPLAWVEEKPVYHGDILYDSQKGYEHKILRSSKRGSTLVSEHSPEETQEAIHPALLTWTKPKTKQKKEGWINIYADLSTKLFSTKAESNMQATYRIATIRIEWEE